MCDCVNAIRQRGRDLRLCIHCIQGPLISISMIFPNFLRTKKITSLIHIDKIRKCFQKRCYTTGRLVEKLFTEKKKIKNQSIVVFNKKFINGQNLLEKFQLLSHKIHFFFYKIAILKL